MQKVLGYLTGLLSLRSTTTSTPSVTDLDWKYMRASISALPSPCYKHAFGSVIVNGTDGQLLCTGYNKEDSSGDPTEHGEVDAIRNCVKKFKDEGYSVDEINAIWKNAWIYTTAEPCAMCGATILHAGFQRVIYATSSPGLYGMGWTKYLISVRMQSLADRAAAQPGFGNGAPITIVIPDIAANETDGLFNWQFHPDAECPSGCHRKHGQCVEDRDDE
ncbi:uncharacterized protein DFL_005398 [Arthrobotrys flagrans]|uniref:CMP/dCMP-type deaminase domain-containing protein n=1 Tax=Arthrobotrys flagrans TaxID=97331 RepID=A0A437A7I2_ARTFL|nr:hypothetical protein DFL_005398 [Arthrobotrys flagrans]